MQIRVDIAPTNAKPERGVTLTNDAGTQHYEALRLDSGFARREFIKRAAQKFHLSVQDLQGVDDEVVKEALAQAGHDREDVRFEGITCADLMATEYEVNFLIQGILVDRQPCMLAGPQKILKTSVLIDLALSLSRGGFFLGKFRVPRAVTVGLMTGESGMPTVQETIRRIADAAGHDPSTIRNFVVTDRVPLFGHLLHSDAFKAFILDHQLEVVAVDPLYLCLEGDNQANLAAQGQQLRRVNEICQENGVCLILAHHTRKETARTYEPLDLSALSGAGHAEFARQWMFLSRRKPYVPGTGSHKLWFSVGGSTGHGGLWGLDVEEGVYSDPGGRYWHVEVLNLDEVEQGVQESQEAARTAKQQKQLEADKNKIVNTLARFPNGETKCIVRDLTGLHTNRFQPALADLLDDGDVMPCSVSKPSRKTAYEGYKLAD